MERLQRFSIRKLSIGAVSCVIGTVAFLSYSNEVKAAENTDTSLKIVETNSANNPTTSNVTVDNTNKQAVVNASDQSKSEDSSAVAPTSEKTQLQTSQDSSIKVKENNLNTDKSDTPKAVVQPTSLNDENNLRDPDSKDVEVKPKESSNVDTNEQKENDVTLATNSPTSETNASSKSVQTVSSEQPADTTDVQPASDQVESAAANSNASENDVSAASASTVLSKQPANADTQPTATASGVQPFVNLAVESDNNDLTPKHETIDSQWTIHYVNQADHKQELKDPTVITMQYTRTNTPQSDGTTEYGDWSYVPGSFKQTGTPITVKDSDNPVKQDNVDKNGENFDVFTITAMYPTVAGYGFYNGINGTRLHDNLRNNERQADTMSKDFYAEYDVAKPTQETVGSQWRIHYIDSTNHEHELKAPTVINMQYVRTNTPQSDGTIQHGDWSYVPGSFKQTGTQITVNDNDNPVKEDNVDKDGKNYDIFTITAMYPTVAGYNFHNGTNNTPLHDYLLNYDPNGNIQMPTMGRDFYVEYDPISERSVAVKFVDDQSYDFNTSDHKKQVGQAITVTGHDGDTVDLKLTVPDKYQLADGQQLPTTYTFAKGSGDLKIHLVHKVVQREAAIDVQLGLATLVRTRGADGNDAVQNVVTQTRWKQLEDSYGNLGHSNILLYALPLVEVGTLTGHVDYDLVDEKVVSLKNDWTSLNLSGHSYELPNGTEVVNGIRIDASDTIGKKLRDDWYLNEYRKWHSDVDPDYITRPWYGYLSVNETNNEINSDYGIMSDVRELGLQAGLVGDEPNALAKAIGDRAATSVEMVNKNIDLNLLQAYDFDFSEQDGRLRAKAPLLVAGVYIPYVEKTATRTINVTTPDGKTTTVKQTATLAKQVDFGKDAHPAWTTGEWSSYDAPAIPGYTPSQSQIAKEAVTGTTEDQTVNISYTANPQTTTVVYQTEDGTPVHTTTVNGHTGQTVKVSNEVPTGWHLVNGTVPSEITFGPNGTPKTVVTIAHSHATVTPDAPKTTSDKLPDNPAKTYPAGVSHDDLNKTITGTIKVTMPDGQIKTVVKAAHLTRTADVDEVTGEVTYSDWTTGYWSDYTAPSVPGYTANYPYIAGQLVTGETTDQTIEITYTANDGTQTIVYQDEDGSEVGKQVVPGKTDETVKVTPDVPDGYVVKGEVPSEVTIKPDDTPITVTVEHGKSHVTPDKPVNKGDLIPDTKDKHYPEGLTHNDLNKTVTRTVSITDPSGKKTTRKQTVTFTRDATVDEVTGKVTYGTWSENGKHIFDEVNVPYITGYRASEEVPEVTVIPDSESTKVNVTYVAKTYDVYVFYINGTSIYDRESFDKHANGELGIAKPEVLRGRYGESINVPIKQIQGYYVNPYGHYSNYKFGIDNVTGQELSWYDFSPAGDKDLKDPLPENASDLDKEYSMPRYISVVYIKDDADKGYNTRSYNIGYVDTEGAVISRPTNLRGISGTDTNFTAPTFEGYTLTNPQDVPTKFGKTSKDIFLVYKPQDVKVTYHYVDETGKELVPSYVENNHFTGLTHVDQKDAKTIPGYGLVSTPEQTVVDGLKDLDLYFTYKANDGSQTISYQDNGQEVGKQVITGKTDQTVKVTPELPDGYVVKSEIPKEVTIRAKDDAIVIAVEHGKAHISPDKPVNKGDLIEGTKDKHYPSGLTHDDLNKTITRKVTIIDPTGKKTITMQTVTFTRDATVDEVTGEVTYGNWSENGQHTFDKVEVPTISGYTANSDVPSILVTPSSTSGLDKVVTYVANEGSQTIIYVDENGKKVGQQVVTGKTGDKVKVTPEIPSGYESNDKLPKEVTIKAKDEPLIVKVIEKIPEVNPDQNVTDDDSNKNINQESTPEQSSEDTSKDTESHEVKTDNKKNHTISVQEKHSDHKKLGEKLTVTTKSESKLRTAASKPLEKMSNSTLPQTGKSKDFLSIMGLVAATLSGLFSFRLRKNKNE